MSSVRCQASRPARSLVVTAPSALAPRGAYIPSVGLFCTPLRDSCQAQVPARHSVTAYPEARQGEGTTERAAPLPGRCWIGRAQADNVGRHSNAGRSVTRRPRAVRLAAFARTQHDRRYPPYSRQISPSASAWGPGMSMTHVSAKVAWSMSSTSSLKP